MKFKPPDHWRVLDAAEIDSWDCKSLRVVVDNIAAAATLIWLAADSQTGKTLFSLWLCLQLLCESMLFGRYKITPVKKIGYFVLEDPDRRIEARLRDMGAAIKTKGQLLFYIAPEFKLTDDDMVEWLRKEIKKEKFDVLFLDTYQKATGGLLSYDDAKQTPILQSISNLSREMDVLVFVLDHMRKPMQGAWRKQTEPSIMDIKGTGAKVQNSDGIILLEKDKSGRMYLWSSHKDFDEHPYLELAVSKQGSHEPKFSFLKDVRKKAKKVDDTVEEIFAATGNDWKSSGELQKVTNISPAHIRRCLKILIDGGRLEARGVKKKARYRKIEMSDKNAALPPKFRVGDLIRKVNAHSERAK